MNLKSGQLIYVIILVQNKKHHIFCLLKGVSPMHILDMNKGTGLNQTSAF